MKCHNLKILPQYFKSVVDVTKKFEIRRNDRDYKVGDCLFLNEFDGTNYTGKRWAIWIRRRVCNIIYKGRGIMNDFMLSKLTKLKESMDKIKDILDNDISKITRNILSNAESMSNEYTEDENKLVDNIEETIVYIQNGLDKIYTYDDWNDLLKDN